MADAAASYVGKWQQRQPEMRVLEAFAAPQDRALLAHWSALWHEFDEAIFELSDPQVARSKLGWWARDLCAGSGAQHPLARALLADRRVATLPAEFWQQLLQQAIVLASDEAGSTDVAAAQQRWRPLAEAFAQIERALFGSADAATIAAQWRFARALRALRRGRPEQAELPLQLLARHGLTLAALSQQPAGTGFWRDYADALHPATTSVPPQSLLRTARQRFDRLQLRRLAAGQSLEVATMVHPLRALWEVWRAVRGSRRV